MRVRQCPYPFEEVRGVCLFLSKVTRPWVAARQYCQGLGGDLATPPALPYILLNYIIEKGGKISTGTLMCLVLSTL